MAGVCSDPSVQFVYSECHVYSIGVRNDATICSDASVCFQCVWCCKCLSIVDTSANASVSIVCSECLVSLMYEMMPVSPALTSQSTCVVMPVSPLCVVMLWQSSVCCNTEAKKVSRLVRPQTLETDTDTH